ncbi:MAG TPA: hypothetical protein VKB08_05300 [Bradyrhizobium sp.]|nr:hypothetical protein [Bradyrhizobium sp.]
MQRFDLQLKLSIEVVMRPCSITRAALAPIPGEADDAKQQAIGVMQNHG